MEFGCFSAVAREGWSKPLKGWGGRGRGLQVGELGGRGGGGGTLQQVELHMRLMLRTAGLKIWSALKVFSGEVW